MLLACRSNSVWSDLNSPCSTVRSPVNVDEADCVARVFMRSNTLLMLLRPPSMICRVLIPSLALRTPCVSSAVSLRYWLATARPAASSPDWLMRYPEVNRWMVVLWKLLLTRRFSCATREFTLVWIDIDILKSFRFFLSTGFLPYIYLIGLLANNLKSGVKFF